MAGMVSVDEALRLIREHIAELTAESVPLADAAGRVLADAVTSRVTQPPFAASAMDGFAVRWEDVRQSGARLAIIGESVAGERFHGRVGAGEAVRIFTGAPMPAGADHVLIQEEAQRNGAYIICLEDQKRASNVRLAGIDFHIGDGLATKGETLTGPMLALIAAGNIDRVKVVRQPRVAIIANGDELAAPGGDLSDDQIVSSIPFGLAPMISSWGGAPRFLGVARDDPADIRRLIDDAGDCDIIAPIGGASVGDRDFMRDVFSARGAAPIFEKVSVKPGKPTWFAKLDGGRYVLGLPGNPASALVTARLFLKTAIDAALGRRNDETTRFARLVRPLPANGPRETYLRARLSSAQDGALAIDAFDDQDSSLLSVLARSNALIRRPSGALPAIADALVPYVNI